MRWKSSESGYEVSDTGQVRSCTGRYKGRILSQHTRKGYPYVTLRSRGKRKKFSVHRLVASAFLLGLEGQDQVNHRDGNKQNNNIDNLEWCTPLENTRHANRTGLTNIRGGRHPKTKFTQGHIDLIRGMYDWSEARAFAKNRKAFSSTWLAKCFKVTHSTILRIVKKDTWI